MNDLKIREAAVADLPQMCSLFQNDLGYAECTQEIVEKQFAGLDSNRRQRRRAVCQTRRRLFGNPVLPGYTQSALFPAVHF